jgi:hypothetical protein
VEVAEKSRLMPPDNRPEAVLNKSALPRVIQTHYTVDEPYSFFWKFFCTVFISIFVAATNTYAVAMGNDRLTKKPLQETKFIIFLFFFSWLDCRSESCIGRKMGFSGRPSPRR